MPREVALQLSYKDVFLDYFKGRQNDILALRCGDMLSYNSADNTFVAEKNGRNVAKLSKKMQDTISQWANKGYQVKSSKIRFIVAWKSKNDSKEERETAVILIDMLLQKEK